MRKFGAVALAVLLAGCAPKGIVSTENLVVVQALTLSKAIQFATGECQRYGKAPILTQTSLRTYVFNCGTVDVPVPPQVPPKLKTATVQPMPMARAPAPQPPPPAPVKVTPVPVAPPAAPPPPQPAPAKAAPAPVAPMQAVAKPPPPPVQQAARPLRRDPAPAKTTAKRGWWVQVSADRSRKEAEATGFRVMRKFEKLLKAKKYRVVPVPGGVYYRSRFGPYPSRTAAVTVCDEMKNRNQACIIVR